MQKPTVGRIVHYFPGTLEGSPKLPNNMEFAPAIITQTFGDTLCNLTLFTAQPDLNQNPNPQRWSVQHKSEIGNPGMPHWDWPVKES